MAVKRIVCNIATDKVDEATEFYSRILDMELVMDQGWIQTYASPCNTTPQISVASEGGSGTPVPDLSIEVDNFEQVHQRLVASRFAIEYGPVDEPWGIRRLYVRDPFNRLVNISMHL